ncbi:MAG: lysylphosphatidylglycerol synthase transmembrane domain-containing protein [Anaerolineales bacterium]
MKRSVSIFRDLLSAAPEPTASRGRALFWTSILIGAFFLYLALRGLDWRAFILTFRNADYIYLPLIFLWGSSSYWVRALRWRILLTAEKQIPLPNVFWANMAGYLGNNILPARAGEFIRAAYLGKENEISTSFVFATGLVERLMDVIALIILGSISLAITKLLFGPMQVALQTMSAISIFGLLVIILLPRFGARIRKVVAALPGLDSSTKLKLAGFLDQFLRGLEALHKIQRIIGFILLTALIWSMDALGAVFLSRILHLSISLDQAFVLLAGLGLSSAIPSTPGYVGVYQFVAVVILEPFGISRADALAFILFIQIINLLALLAWGIVALLKSPLRNKSYGSHT